jgi:spermidine synthase
VVLSPNLWWSEDQTPALRLGLRCTAVLDRRRSAYQEIAVYQTEQYGRLLALDDMVMTTEADEFVYHEMLVHPALAVAEQTRRVLVVGGGDGGCVREVCKHSGVERIVLAELDGDVIDVCRQHLPSIAGALGNSRVEIRVGDGVAFLACVPEASFDAILVDAPDPIGPAEGLFGEPFYAAAARALAPGGVLAAQTECPFLHGPLIRKVQAALRTHFPSVGLYWAVIPTYPGAMWTFSIAAKGSSHLAAPRRAPAGSTRYWSANVHAAAFVLPPFVRALVGDEG